MSAPEKPKKKGLFGLGRHLHHHHHTHHDDASMNSGTSKVGNTTAEPVTPSHDSTVSPRATQSTPMRTADAEESIEYSPFASAIPHSPGSVTYKKGADTSSGSNSLLFGGMNNVKSGAPDDRSNATGGFAESDVPGAGAPFPQIQTNAGPMPQRSAFGTSIPGQGNADANLSRAPSSIKQSRPSTPGLEASDAEIDDTETEHEPDSGSSTQRLVSNLLLEAAMDTPSFRASVNYVDTQFKELQAWLAGLTARSANHAAHLNAIKDSINGVIEHFMPPFTHNSILLQDYTTLLFSKFATSESTFWTELIAQVQQSNDALQAAVKRLTQGVLARYSKARAAYITALHNHEAQRKIVMRMPADAEPAALRDAAHRSYNHTRTLAKAATALVLAIGDVESETSLTLMDTLSAQALGRSGGGTGSGLSKSRSDIIIEMHRIRSLSTRLRAGFPNTSADLRAQRSSLLRKVKETSPPRELSAYHADAAKSTETEVKPYKYGWVQVHFESSGPESHVAAATAAAVTGSAWESCWAFVQNGLFGALSLDSTGTKVLETTKFATANLTIEELPPQETRAYAMKLQMDSHVVYLQAETRTELLSWMNVLTKSREAQIPVPALIAPWHPSFATPEAIEMASKSLGTSAVAQRAREVGSDIRRTDWLRADSTLTSDGSTFPVHTIPAIKPLPSAHMSDALIANWFFRPQGVPNAITANYWGVANWQYSITEAKYSQGFPKYPDNYPRRLIVQDGDLRSIASQLPVEQQPAADDLLQFIIRGTTMLLKREMPMRLYVTSHTIVLYVFWRGLISIQSVELSRIVDIEARHGVDFSDLRLALQTDGGGDSNMLDFRLYVDSSTLMKRKLSIIIENLRSRNPMNPKELFEHLALVNFEYAESLRQEESQKQARFLRPGKDSASHGIAGFLLNKPVGSGAKRGEEDTLQIGKGMHAKVSEDTFPISAEALFLTMFGSKSPVYTGEFTGVIHGTSKAGPWYRRGRFIERRVVQHANVLGSDDPSTEQQMFHYQRIEQMKTDFYVITERRSAWEMPHGDQFYLVFKYCIYSTVQGSHIQIWNRTVWTKRSGIEHTKDDTVTEFAKLGIRTVMLRTRKAASQISNARDASHRYGTVRPTKIVEGKETRELEQTVTRVSARSFFSLMTRLPLSMFLRSAQWVITNAINWVCTLSSPLLILLVTSFISLMLNTVLYRKSYVAYWSAQIQNEETRRVVETANLVPEKGTIFRRAIYTQDLNDAITDGLLWGADGIHNGIGVHVNNNATLCSARFGEIAKLAWTDEYENLYEYEPSVLETLRRIANVRQNYALRRTEMLSRLRLLNANEREQLMHEYRKWLVSEANMCSLIRSELPKLQTAVFHEIRGYCISCLDEAKGLL